mmetsp:Transcript_13707/g.51120  ORF Transcript_13707/g.51120 Transcript_13707/m.51120 type:complete len:204 (-) Transcript_13707:562-1173(-)
MDKQRCSAAARLLSAFRARPSAAAARSVRAPSVCSHACSRASMSSRIARICRRRGAVASWTRVVAAPSTSSSAFCALRRSCCNSSWRLFTCSIFSWSRRSDSLRSSSFERIRNSSFSRQPPSSRPCSAARFFSASRSRASFCFSSLRVAKRAASPFFSWRISSMIAAFSSASSLAISKSSSSWARRPLVTCDCTCTALRFFLL